MRNYAPSIVCSEIVELRVLNMFVNNALFFVNTYMLEGKAGPNCLILLFCYIVSCFASYEFYIVAFINTITIFMLPNVFRE